MKSVTGLSLVLLLATAGTTSPMFRGLSHAWQASKNAFATRIACKPWLSKSVGAATLASVGIAAAATTNQSTNSAPIIFELPRDQKKGVPAGKVQLKAKLDIDHHGIEISGAFDNFMQNTIFTSSTFINLQRGSSRASRCAWGPSELNREDGIDGFIQSKDQNSLANVIAGFGMKKIQGSVTPEMDAEFHQCLNEEFSYDGNNPNTPRTPQCKKTFQQYASHGHADRIEQEERIGAILVSNIEQEIDKREQKEARARLARRIEEEQDEQKKAWMIAEMAQDRVYTFPFPCKSVKSSIQLKMVKGVYTKF